MVNMVGFHRQEPHYNTASFGEPGHYFQIHERGSRIVVTFPCGRATFDGPEDARQFLGFPGDVGHAAAFYLASLEVIAA